MNRNQFLKTSLLGLSGICLSPGWLRAGTSPAPLPLPPNWAWLDGWIGTTKEEWLQLFNRLLEGKVGALLVSGSNELYEKLGRIGEREGMQIHTWRWTMNRGDYMRDHPDWYTVNRLGQSVIDKPPYVGYYRWLCPSHPEVRETLVKDYCELASIPGIGGVHLDYVRYCDIYLPIGLQPRYNLKQDHEMPEFDYCYCPLCRETFRSRHGYDPMKTEDPAADLLWRQFRLDQLVEVVRAIADAIHRKGSVITGAVFPTPEMSRRMVRQDWARFGLDAYLPMLYHRYYLEPTTWIGRCLGETVAEMGPDAPVYAGIMANPSDFTPDVLAATIRQVREAGGRGLAAFTAGGLSAEMLAVLGKQGG